MQEQGSPVGSVVLPAKLEVWPDFPAIGAREAGSVGYIISIPDKSSPGIYRMLCQNQRRHGYYHNVPSCNMCACSGNGTQERAVQDLLCLVDLYLVYLI